MSTEKTLEQLENNYWGNAPEGSSRLVARCHELRRKKIKDLEVEDLRVLIGQNIGLQFLIPLAIDLLRKNPFIEADFYEGDLLQNVLQSRQEFWRTHPALKAEVVDIFKENKGKLLEELNVSDEIKKGLLETFEKFIES